MNLDSKNNFYVIIPCYNEELYIENCLNSILSQSILPKQIIVVNDGSTDLTGSILAEFRKTNPLIKIVNSNQESIHEPGAKIVKAFKVGLENTENWEVIFKLDADVVLPEHYFKKVIHKFKENPKIGMVGGLIYTQKKNQLVYESISDKKHLRGPIKSYSKNCFNAIGGIKESIGWDTIDEILAQYHGFKVEILEDLKVVVQKPTGSLYNKSHAKKMGISMYKMRYGFLITLIAAIKIGVQKKNPFVSFNVILAFLGARLNKKKQIVNQKEGEFVRKYRWKMIQSKLF